MKTCLSAFLACALTFAATTKLTSVEGITEYQLDNGLHLLVFPDPSKPNITVNMTYLVGSRHEGTAKRAWRICWSTWFSKAARSTPTSRRS